MSPPDMNLRFALNDINPSIVARAGILLYLCSQLDHASPGDVEFLWSLWYNMELTAQQHRRLRAAVGKFLKNPDHGWIKFDSKHWDTIASVLESWDVEGRRLPDVETVKKERRAYIESRFRSQPGLRECTFKEFTEKMDARFVGRMGSGSHGARARKESSKFWWEGSTSKGESRVFEKSDKGTFPNVTLLHHESRDWRLHYGTSPFEGYEQLVTLDRVKEAGSLVKACQKQMKMWMKAFRGRTLGFGSGHVKISLHLGDALEFCMRDGGVYDVIDTSNLDDHIGLLNLLVFCSPRLAKKPTSRLLTASLIWATESKTISEYIDQSLCFNVHLAPSLLGLKLITDVLMDGKYNSLGLTKAERVLEWQPIPPSTAPLCVATGSLANSLASNIQGPDSGRKKQLCAISTSLSSVLTASCFLPFAGLSEKNVSLERTTVATFTALLKHMVDQRIILMPSCDPHDAAVMFCKTYCTSFGMEAEVVGRRMDPKRGGLLEFRGQAGNHIKVAAGITPVLRVALVHKSLWVNAMMGLPYVELKLSSNKLFRRDKKMDLIHLLDSLVADKEFNVSFLLPEDHGLDVSNWVVVLIDVSLPLGLSLPSVKDMSSFKAFPYEERDKEMYSRSARGASVSSRLPVSGDLAMEDLQEYETSFIGHISFTGSPSGLFTKYYQQRKGQMESSSLIVDVGFKEPEENSVKIVFPFPVTSAGSNFTILESERKVKCVFAKGSTSQHGPVDEKLINVGSLPHWTNVDRLLDRVKRMFNVQENLHRLEGMGVSSGDPYFDLRCSLEILFVKSISEGIRLHVITTNELVDSRREPDITLVVDPPAHEMDDGEAALLVMYCDHQRALEMVHAGKLNVQTAGERYVRIRGTFANGPLHRVLAGNEELKLLKKVLHQNSLKLEPSPWQERFPGKGFDWVPSFVTPLYPEHPVEGKVGSQALKNSLKAGGEDLERMIQRLKEKHHKS